MADGLMFFGGFFAGIILATVLWINTDAPSVSHDKLVRTGHGEYVMVDPLTGKVEFRLKEMKND